MSAIIQGLFAIATAAFVFSLPFSRTAFGATLRRIAGGAFVLALLPAIITGLVGPLSEGISPSGVVVALAVAAIIAYGALRLRAPAPNRRSGGLLEKTPIDRRRRREQEFFAFLSDRQRSPED